VNQFQDRGRVRQHAAMTGSRRQAAGVVAPARWRPSGWAGMRPPGGRWSSRCGGVSWALGERWAWDPFARHPTGSPSRERALLAARDIAILQGGRDEPAAAPGHGEYASAVLGVVGGLVALPLGVRTYHGLMTQLARQVGNRPPPFAFDVLHPTTLYPLGAMGLAVALADVVFPARRAARSRAAAILRSE
jgi:hypothetical protein